VPNWVPIGDAEVVTDCVPTGDAEVLPNWVPIGDAAVVPNWVPSYRDAQVAVGWVHHTVQLAGSQVDRGSSDQH
jgi:hypothetical protein